MLIFINQIKKWMRLFHVKLHMWVSCLIRVWVFCTFVLLSPILYHITFNTAQMNAVRIKWSTAATPGFKCSPLEIKYMLFPIFLWLVSHCRRCLDKSNKSIKKEKEKKNVLTQCRDKEIKKIKKNNTLVQQQLTWNQLSLHIFNFQSSQINGWMNEYPAKRFACRTWAWW